MTAAHLPNRFPAGTRYVIEGRRGKSGKLLIVSRQLILPDGQCIDIKAASYERPRPAQRKRERRISGRR
jgi:hypothetical protein